MSVGNVRFAPGARPAWHAHVSKPFPASPPEAVTQVESLLFEVTLSSSDDI
jgi:hypothetical protein